MTYIIEYKFSEVLDYVDMQAHVALIIDEATDETIHCISGRVVDGWTKEGVTESAQQWIERKNRPERSLSEILADHEQDNSYEFGESAASRAYEQSREQSQAEHNTANAERVATEFGGVAIKISDKTALEAAGCVYARWETTEPTDTGKETTVSMEWQKDGRLLTVICQDYYLVL